MKLDSLPHYLCKQKRRMGDLVIEFDDGDKYPVAALDLWGENPEGEYEISVQFEDCLGRSEAEAQALEAGSLKRSPPGIWWTSVTPNRPVGKLYTTRQIKSVFDNGAGYGVYEREPPEG
jgi:hypothetical protein